MQCEATTTDGRDDVSFVKQKTSHLSDSEVSVCGVYWTKFECISDKIRRILTNNVCALHARFARDPKTKNFLTIPFSAGGVGGAGKKWKGKFWFWFRRFIPPERTCIYILAWWRYFVRPFFRHSRRCEALSYPRFVVVRVSAHTSQSPRIGRSRSLTMPARYLLRVRPVTSFEPVVSLKCGLC